MAYSDAANKATQKWRKNADLVALSIYVPREVREHYKAVAADRGQSLRQYVLDALAAAETASSTPPPSPPSVWARFKEYLLRRE